MISQDSSFEGLGPSPLKVSNWLESWHGHLIAQLTQERGKLNNKSKALSLLTLIHTVRIAHGLLQIQPESAIPLKRPFMNARVYFDCLWQLTLLNRAKNEKESNKVSYLYSDVEMNVSNHIKSVMKSPDPACGSLLELAVGDDFMMALTSGVISYIQGKGMPSADKRMTAQEKRFVQILMDDYRAASVAIEGGALTELVVEESRAAFSFKPLLNFDLSKCDVVKLPEDFYN